MGYYTVGKFSLQIDCLINQDEDWKLFEVRDVTNCIANLVITSIPKLAPIHGVYHTETVNCYSHYMAVGDSSLAVTKDWMKGCFINTGTLDDQKALLLQFFYACAVQYHFLQIHSSLISYRKNGIMFLGPSGIGKTTQAELWNKYMGAQIINGDLVFVQQTNQDFYGWGTPWHGSSPYCENTRVPLRAMVVLKQSKENALRRITGFEMVSEVAKSIFYPMWLENGTELCLETLNALLGQIPVYELSCRPDEDSVRLLYNELVKSKLL